MLVQSSKVESIGWTGSGDGIIAGGIDVILWRRRSRTWEIAWKFKRDDPQNLVSATWSIEGPSATAACPSELQSEAFNHVPKCVLVCYGDGGSEYEKAELHHPQPVSMIQWRPSTRRQSKRDVNLSSRHVLLTCCLDGTIRLWTAVDNGKIRKLGRDNNDHKTVKRSFCIAAVMEVNQALNGTLGVDVFFSWATQIGGLHRTGEGANQFFFIEGNGHDMVGRCEWLIGFGPGTLVTFWSIHCLDDISPMRFPRVMLWKRQELQDLEVGHLRTAGCSSFKDWILLNKVVISRNCLSGPPNICSLIHVLPCSSLVWSLLYTQTSSNIEDASFNNSKIDRYLSCSSDGVLNGGHTGKILQVAVYPRIYEVELAVSLDSNGLLLFWSVSTISNCNLGLSALIPSWKLCGKLVTCDSCSKYTSLRWAPSILGEDHVLLVGHTGGIDLFIVKISQIGEDDIICHYICTIPLAGHGPYEDGPTDIFAIPLPSTCNKTFKYNKFLLLGVWLKGFQALSWEVTLHCYDLLENCCECNFDDKNTPCISRIESTFANKRYCLGVNPCSSQLPEPYSQDQITSFAVLCPGNLMTMQESLGVDKDLFCGVPPYTMATGCTDGSLKLWRSKSSEQSTHIPWELVGKFVAHEGPVIAISLSNCGQRIATICTGSHLDGDSILHIWDTVHLMGAGSFMLEDRLSIKRDVVALNWLALGNGRLLLGVCMQNELQVYAQKRSDGQILLSSGKSLNLHNWSCIAVAHSFPAIHNFLWGPLATAVIVHDSYFSLLSQWSFLVDNKQQVKCTNFIREDCNGKDETIASSIFTDYDVDIGDLKELSVENSRQYNNAPPVKINVKNDYISSSLVVAGAQLKNGSGTTVGFWSLVEISEKLRGTLPVYHPMALLLNIYSGILGL